MDKSLKIAHLVENLSNHLFWDVNRSAVVEDQSENFIVERVLEYGRMDDWRLLTTHYEKEELQSIVLQLKRLSDKTLAFVSFYFKLPKESFACYKNKQSHRNFWNC